MKLFKSKNEERIKINLTPGSRYIILEPWNEVINYNIKPYTKYASMGIKDVAIEVFLDNSRVCHRIIGKDFEGTYDRLIYNTPIVGTFSREISKALSVLILEQTRSLTNYSDELQKVLTTVNTSYTKAYYNRITIKAGVRVKKLVCKLEDEEINIRSSKEFNTKEQIKVVLEIGDIYFLEDEGKTILVSTFTGIYEYQIYSSETLNTDNPIVNKFRRLRLL